MSFSEEFLAPITACPSSQVIDTHDLPLKVQHIYGRLDTRIISFDEDAQSSEVLKDLFETAKGCMTRMEKVTLALRLQKAKVYIVPIHPASTNSKHRRHEPDLTDALKRYKTIDREAADALLANYPDLSAGNCAVLVKVSFNKSTFAKIGRVVLLLGSMILHVILNN